MCLSARSRRRVYVPRRATTPATAPQNDLIPQANAEVRIPENTQVIFVPYENIEVVR